MEIKRAGTQPPAKARPSISPARCGSIRFQPARAGPGRVAPGHLRAGRAHGLAHASARPDPDRHRRLRPGAARGRPDRGDPARRRGLVRAGREALAWRHAHHGDEPHRHPGEARTARPSTGWSTSATSNTGRNPPCDPSGTGSAGPKQKTNQQRSPPASRTSTERMMQKRKLGNSGLEVSASGSAAWG